MTEQGRELIERALAYDHSRPTEVASSRGTRTVYPLVNPDGPALAAELERLYADNARKDGAIDHFLHRVPVDDANREPWERLSDALNLSEDGR